MPPSHDQADRLLDRLRALLAEAIAVPVSAYEEEHGRELVPLGDDARAAVSRMIEWLDAAIVLYGRDAESDTFDFDFEESPTKVSVAVDAVVREPTDASTRIADIAFISRMGLVTRRKQLAVLALEPEWEFVSTCGSALREVIKAASAVEWILSEHLGRTDGTHHYVTELEHGLRTRRAYWSLRRDVSRYNDSARASTYERLRSASNAIARLAGRESYAFARFDDRYQLRQIFHRIHDHLRAILDAKSDPERTRELELSGARIWQDLLNLTDLVMQINQREDLTDYDGVVAATVLAALATGAPLSAEHHARLGSLVGRDRGLDDWLESRDKDLGALRTLLVQVSERLARPGRARGAADRDVPRFRHHRLSSLKLRLDLDLKRRR